MKLLLCRDNKIEEYESMLSEHSCDGAFIFDSFFLCSEAGHRAKNNRTAIANHVDSEGKRRTHHSSSQRYRIECKNENEKAREMLSHMDSALGKKQNECQSPVAH